MAKKGRDEKEIIGMFLSRFYIYQQSYVQLKGTVIITQNTAFPISRNTFFSEQPEVAVLGHFSSRRHFLV